MAIGDGTKDDVHEEASRFSLGKFANGNSLTHAVYAPYSTLFG